MWEEPLVWLFEGATGRAVMALILVLLVVKWLVQATRGVVIALRETRRVRNR